MRFWRSTPLGPWKWQKSLFSRKSGILGVHTPWTSKMQSNIWNGVPTWVWGEIAPIPSRCQGNTTYSWSVPRRDLAIFTNACQPCPPSLQTEIYSIYFWQMLCSPPPPLLPLYGGTLVDYYIKLWKKDHNHSQYILNTNATGKKKHNNSLQFSNYIT